MSASARSPISSAGSLTSARRRSDSSTPPGSRSTLTPGWCAAMPATSVDLPAPSIPSTVISTRGTLAAARLEQRVDELGEAGMRGPELLELREERVAALAGQSVRVLRQARADL